MIQKPPKASAASTPFECAFVKPLLTEGDPFGFVQNASGGSSFHSTRAVVLRARAICRRVTSSADPAIADTPLAKKRPLSDALVDESLNDKREHEGRRLFVQPGAFETKNQSLSIPSLPTQLKLEMEGGDWNKNSNRSVRANIYYVKRRKDTEEEKKLRVSQFLECGCGCEVRVHWFGDCDAVELPYIIFITMVRNTASTYVQASQRSVN